MGFYSTFSKDNFSFSSDLVAIFIIFQITIIGWGVSAKMHVIIHSVNSHLIYRELKFLKNHRIRASRFICKNGGDVNKRGQKHCFLQMMYWFCDNNALYSAILSFRIFIFLRNVFNTLDLYYFESNMNLVWHIKVLLMKKEYCFVVSKRWRNNFGSWVCFCVYPKYHLGDIIVKK